MCESYCLIKLTWCKLRQVLLLMLYYLTIYFQQEYMRLFILRKTKLKISDILHKCYMYCKLYTFNKYYKLYMCNKYYTYYMYAILNILNKCYILIMLYMFNISNICYISIMFDMSYISNIDRRMLINIIKVHRAVIGAFM